ncbi:MAG: hypothetical protein ACQETI_00060 [Halobacteriota archaeon]
MSPTRRTVLRLGSLTTLAAVAGCTSTAQRPPDDADGSGGLPTDTADPAGGTRPAGTGGPGLTLSRTDGATDLPVTHSVEVTENVATKDHPPQLRVTVTNDADERIQVGEGRTLVFAYVTDEGDQLILLPADGDYPTEVDCWRLTEPIAVTEEYRIVTLESGQSVTQRLDLYAVADGDGCLPVGEFRFETTYNVVRGASGMPSDGEQSTWGFSVVLE